MKRILEPDTGLIHYEAAPREDAATLCNITDWIGESKGQETKKRATCNACRAIAAHVRGHVYTKLKGKP